MIISTIDGIMKFLEPKTGTKEAHPVRRQALALFHCSMKTTMGGH